MTLHHARGADGQVHVLVDDGEEQGSRWLPFRTRRCARCGPG